MSRVSRTNKVPRSKLAKKATTSVMSSVESNLQPRQPKLRRSPPAHTAPLQPKSSRKTDPKKARTPGKRTSDPNKSPTQAALATSARHAREALALETAEAVAESGMLPHEWMIAVMRGQPINHYAYDHETGEIVEVVVLPTFADRMECAKAAAPYFATKVSKDTKGGVQDPSKQPGVMEVPLATSMEHWADVASNSQAKLKKDVTK